jgi:hypothetical protein
MKLQEALPDSVTVGGKRYRVDLDFRNVLNMLETLSRDDLIEDAREWLAVKCVMRKPPKRGYSAVLIALRLMLFSGNQKEQKKLTDFEQDADLIRAAFRQTYGIDLYRDKLHWFEFTALLANLPEGSRYTDVVNIRLRPLPEPTRYNAKERQWLIDAKARYAIQMTEKEQEEARNASFHATTLSLLRLAKRGGDLNA